MNSMERAAADPQRRTAVSSQAFDVCTHERERFYDPAHGTLSDRGVAGKLRGKGLGGKNSGDQPGGGSAVSAVEAAGGNGKAMEAFSVNQDFLPVGIHADSQGAEAVDAGKAVCAAQEAADSGSAFCQGTEHNTSVRDGFISGDGNFPA